MLLVLYKPIPRVLQSMINSSASVNAWFQIEINPSSHFSMFALHCHPKLWFVGWIVSEYSSYVRSISEGYSPCMYMDTFGWMDVLYAFSLL